MAVSSRHQKNAWEARMQRINTGRTLTQVSDAEGTIPTKMTKRLRTKKRGVNGLAAWVTGGALGWMTAMVLGVTDPAGQLIEQQELREIEPYMAAFGNPILACAIFLLVLSVLRINGFMAKILGVVVMAWVFALEAGIDVPTVADLMSLGEAVLAGEIPFTEQVSALRDWAMTEAPA